MTTPRWLSRQRQDAESDRSVSSGADNETPILLSGLAKADGRNAETPVRCDRNKRHRDNCAPVRYILRATNTAASPRRSADRVSYSRSAGLRSPKVAR